MDDLDFDEFQDICGLGDIFPDIEPYLKDVTSTFENAKAESSKQKLDGPIEGSDSDSGISGDSFATGILNNLEISLRNDSAAKHSYIDRKDMCENKLPDNCIYSDNKKIIIKPSTLRINNDRTILNIVRNSNDSNVKPKHIVIKSQQSMSTIHDNSKRESGTIMPKITTVKILKNGEGCPMIVNEVNKPMPIKNENKSFCDYPKISFQDMTETHNLSINIPEKKDFSVKTLNKNMFLSENLSRPNDTNYSNKPSEIFESKTLSLDMSGIDDFQSMDCSESYYDMFQSSPTVDTSTLSSTTFKSYNSCGGIINPHQFDRMIKKQERMIKNRQAASLSRQRKKEYVERLEHKAEMLKLENQHLQSQINDIKERFCALEQENVTVKRDVQMWRDRYYDLERQKIKQGFPLAKQTIHKGASKAADSTSKGRAIKTTAASTTVLGIFILLTFNFNSWSDVNHKVSLLQVTHSRQENIPIYGSNGDSSILQKTIAGSEGRIGRTLFSVVENSSTPDDPASLDMLNQMCNRTSGLNLTETKRLTLELNEWGSRYKEESVKEYDRIQNEKIKSQILSKEIKSIYRKSKLRYYQIPNEKLRTFSSAELEVYHRNSGYNFLDSFFNDIDQRPDTLYFVSFHSDNLVYPATASKNFSAPKITLLLPADVRQDDEAFYRMMKIDCNVQNFTVVNLKKTRQP